jgi:hypothetical protein
VLDAFDFVSAGGAYEHQAYVCRTTGTVHWVSDAIGREDSALPDDFEESDDYVPVPHKRDLNLGSRLVFAFANQEMPDDYDTIRDIFAGKARIAGSRICSMPDRCCTHGTISRPGEPRPVCAPGARTTTSYSRMGRADAGASASAGINPVFRADFAA